MIRRALHVMAGVGLTLASLTSAPAAMAETPETVIIPGDASVPAKPRLNAWLFRPKGTGKFPGVVAMHGCSGVTSPRGALLPIYQDWGERLVAQSYAVLFVDSFGSRGFGQQCTQKPRQVVPRDRAEDVHAAAAWLAARDDIDSSRLALMGWSHGGSTTLWAVDSRRANPAADFKVAVAFYPGCTVQAKQAGWGSRMPLTILMGAADDWTPAEPCRALGSRANVRYVEYPGAYHAFDNPKLPLRVRTGLTFSAKGDGTAHVGTDPAARAAAIIEVEQALRDAFNP